MSVEIFKPRTAFDWPALVSLNLPSSMSNAAEDSDSDESLGSDGEGGESGYYSDITEDEPVRDFGDGSPMVKTILSFLTEKVPDGENYEPVVVARRSGPHTLTLELKKEPLSEDSTTDDENNSDKE